MASNRRRKSSRKRIPWPLLLLVVLLYVLFTHIGPAADTASAPSQPAAAPAETLAEKTASATPYELPGICASRPEQLLRRYSYTLSFNPESNLPNWVAWELNPARLVERESRADRFEPDPDIAPSEAVTTDDYKGSGWDRGHMCPSADNRWHWRAMAECFYMTNICPQHHNLNRGDWKELEEACRRWAAREAVYIACGPILYASAEPRYIGRAHRIRVPEAFFKVVLTGLESDRPRAVGFIYKNNAGNRRPSSYMNSVDEVERITGLDFFVNLPDEVETRVERAYDPADWQ